MEERLSRLERENRRLKLAGVVALGVIAAVVFLSPLLALGLNVNDWKQLGENERTMYIAGAADAIHHLGDMLELDLKAGTHLLVKRFVDISDCLVERKMNLAQIVAIVKKYIKNNPETWDFPVSSQTWAAMSDACGLSKKE